jgi:predicted enzyme related to lactoylglutathione lyase
MRNDCGSFFRAREPKALGAWYHQHLGIDLTPTSYDQRPWHQEAGPTIIEPFPSDADYFGSKDKMWMLNFRVRNLAAMVEQLRRAGIAVDVDKETYPNGTFPRLQDPEGNPIQLWQEKKP